MLIFYNINIKGIFMGLSGISFGSLLLIAFVAMIFFGPAQLKVIARDLGEALAEFKQGLDRVTRDKSDEHS
jgi:TatA/E family protein of Tat protein translocase